MSFPLTVKEFLSASLWEDFEINGKMYWSSRSAIEECGGLEVKSWYVSVGPVVDDYNEVDVYVKIEAV